MYLTRMKLNLSKRDTVRAMQSPNLIHGAVEQAFPGGRDRRLWRLDSLGGATYLLLLSREKPNLTNADAQFGDGRGWETRPYEPLLTRIAPGTHWRFRLTANPTCNEKPKGRGSRGKVHAHITPKFQEKWFLDKAKAYGMEVERNCFPAQGKSDDSQMEQTALLVTGSQWYRFYKEGNGKPISLLAVSYEGSLTVTNAELFRKALTEGIGRGKAYGMGLLTVAEEG
ncbi:MAG: type I-E CRISPR-associated protein Cas6/Cse3/CasE [Oscillibacter sp.]|nr:type I-E CRISPR-associated protein Cas6/Cse3/CasE [Oscillibacter sp.]MBQ9616800.1 type I-E CRISPR-associated protein Cas6/Cse3/CasE [Oscillibacter sp.]